MKSLEIEEHAASRIHSCHSWSSLALKSQLQDGGRGQGNVGECNTQLGGCGWEESLAWFVGHLLDLSSC